MRITLGNSTGYTHEFTIDRETFAKMDAAEARGMPYHWRATEFGRRPYVYAIVDRQTIWLHRWLLGITDRRVTVEFLDGDSANYTLANLRPIPRAAHMAKIAAARKAARA